jgi:hypothetical protein
VKYNNEKMIFSFICDYNWNLVEYEKKYKILKVNEFGDELK